jgi:DNA polymerase-3 subunit epsilon
MTLQLTRPLVVLDTETTGLEPGIDRIVQIGIVRVEAGRDPGRYKYLVNPGVPIPPEATAIHGITDEMVKDERAFAYLWPMLLRVGIDGADLCAYNARFDLAMIDAELSRAALTWDRSGVRIIDPMMIFRARHPHTLEGACKEYGVGNLDDAHDALADASATLAVLGRMLARYDMSIEEAADQSVQPPDDRYCDSGRKFAWRFHRPVHAQGKHRGKPIDCDLGYLEWMLRGIQDLPADTRALIEQVMEGDVPTNQPNPAPLREVEK